MAKYRKPEPSKNYMSGGGIGSLAGSILGSIIPGVGTAIGGSVGGMLGNIISPNKQEIQQPPRPIEPTMRFENGGKKKMAYKDWYKLLPKEKQSTQSYNLERAYELASQNEVDAFASNPEAHLRSFYMNEDGVGEFVKKADHDTIGKELDFYYGDSPESNQFRENYVLDTRGDYYKYLPRNNKNLMPRVMEMGGMLTPIEAGGSHSENGLGGVPIGNNASVEQGETMTEDFVYSDKLKINKTLAKEFSLPKSTIGKTFSQASKSLTIDQEDVISQRGNERMLNRIAEAQEAYKQSFGDKYYQNEQPTVQMVHGGPHNPLMEGVGMQGLGMQDFIGTPDYLGGMPMGTMPATSNTPAPQTQVTPGFENRYGTFMDPNLQVQFEPQSPVVNPDATQNVTPDVTPEAVDPEVTVQSENGQTLRTLNLNTNLFGNQNQFSAFNTPSLGFGQTQTFNPLDPFGLNRMNQGLNLRTGGSDTSTTNVGEGAADETGAANTEDTALGKAKFSALRYAPIASDIYSLATADRPTPMDPSRYQQFGTFTENLVDRAQARKDAMDAASTTAQYLQESSGGNAALFSAMMQGADTRSQRALGDLSYQQDIADAQEKARVEGLKNRQQMMNAQIRQQIDIQNQQDQAAYSNMMQDSLTNLAQNIANVGTEQTRMSQVNQLFGYDVYGQYKNAVKDGTTSAKSISEYIQGLIGK